MWIAKNSITGKTYGKKFNSIYDCQTFINTKLGVLQYEFKKVFALEREIENSLKERDIFQIMSDALKEFENCDAMQDLRKGFEMSLQGKKQQEIDDEINRLALVRWSSNNVIRCWYVEQKRFADGFDF